jgi:hypothetical protein
MKQYFATCLLLVGIIVSAWGQEALDKIIHIWGNNLWQVSPITVDPLGNIYLAGQFEDTVFIDSKDNWIVNKDSADFFIIKADPDGSVIWTKVVSGMGSEFIFDLEVDRDGNIFVIGQFDQTMLIDTAHIDIGKESDFYIAKLNPDGNLVDVRLGNESGEELHFRGCETDGHGSLYLIGETRGNQVFEFPFDPPGNGYYPSFVARLDGGLEAEWIISLGDSLYTAGEDTIEPTNLFDVRHGAVMPDLENQIFVAGTAGSDVFISKIDQEGKLLWIDQTNTIGYWWVNDVLINEKNEAYLIGASSDASNKICFPDTIHGSVFITKYSNGGDYMWSLGLDTEWWTYVVDRNGYTSAIYYEEWGSLDGLMIIDPDGHIVYDRPFDQVTINQLVLDESGSVYYNGFFLEDITIGGQDLNPENGENYVFGRMNVTAMIGGTFEETISQIENLRLYPNPVSNMMTVESEQEEILDIRILSLSGQELLYAKTRGFNQRINLSFLKEGVYFITVQSSDFISTRKFIKL